MTHPHNEPCPTCLGLDLKLRWQTHDDGRRHIRGICAKCGRFRLWVAGKLEAAAEADANEPTGIGPGLFDNREDTT